MSEEPGPEIQALFRAAEAVRSRAHAPYSAFRVGAAIRSETGRVHVGCNVENAAYPVGTCAEAGAIAAMIAAGDRSITAIAVGGSGPEPCMPCGACRQRIAEFAQNDTIVYCFGNDSKVYVRASAMSLLPLSFSCRDLRPPRSRSKNE
jgi:cytidine deaminase